MIPSRTKLVTSLTVGMLVLVSFTATLAQERVISFTKDIDVLPVNSDPRSKINIRLDVDKTRVGPGDTVKIHFETDRDCYLTLIDVGTSGKITRLWPNQFSGADNLVRGRTRYSFPAATDSFQYRVSGPDGTERIVAVATSDKNRIVKEEEFSEYKGGFKSYAKQLKDLVVESSRRSDEMSSGQWGTAEARFVIGRGPAGGTIRSSNIYLLGVGAATGKLRYCDSDANRFTQMAKDAMKVPAENVKMLGGREATKQGMVDAMRWLSTKTGPEDLVLIYFSGHGTQIKDMPPLDEPDGMDEAFICYHEKSSLSPDDPDLNRVLLVDDEFSRLSKDIPARRKVVVVDSCHSGSIHKAVEGSLISKYFPILLPAQLKELQVVTSSDSGTSSAGWNISDAKDTLVSACADSESSFEDRSKESGLFTYWFLQNLKSGSTDLKAAFEKAREKVLEETRGAGLRQTPQLTDEHGLANDIRF